MRFTVEAYSKEARSREWNGKTYTDRGHLIKFAESVPDFGTEGWVSISGEGHLDKGATYEIAFSDLKGKQASNGKTYWSLRGTPKRADGDSGHSQPSSEPKAATESEHSPQVWIDAVTWLMGEISAKLPGADPMNLSTVFNALNSRGVIKQIADNMGAKSEPVHTNRDGEEDETPW